MISRIFRHALLALSLAALAACATPTPYAPAPAEGYGYGAQQLEDGRFRVSFSGNASTPRRTVENYLLYRAAEVTLQQGGDHFVIVRRGTDADTRWYSHYDGPPWYPGFGGVHPWGWGHAFAHRHNHTARAITRYDAHAEILVRRGRKPDDPMAFDAHAVIRNLASEIRNPDPAGG